MQCHLYMHAGSYGNLGCDGGRMTDMPISLGTLWQKDLKVNQVIHIKQR